ncbi:MAG: cob(I)yrinic acid a,c-diamide adenosyltransferase [Ignavibacteriaceae bacterium]|nr:cob(I)yrinic acid a,c-diamide adenosyltransferase [Ignavibacteriaceae bacterium]
MKIYTGKGDRGETGLYGGKRVSKDSQRIEAYGIVDELNSFVGLTITETFDKDVKALLLIIQNQLFTVGADLATPEEKKQEGDGTTSEFYSRIEKEIDKFDAKLEELKSFILPGGSKSSAHLHVCRTIARRAERAVVSLKNKVEIGDNILIFLNRLSDLFFVLARYENQVSGNPDVKWEK